MKDKNSDVRNFGIGLCFFMGIGMVLSAINRFFEPRDTSLIGSLEEFSCFAGGILGICIIVVCVVYVCRKGKLNEEK